MCGSRPLLRLDIEWTQLRAGPVVTSCAERIPTDPTKQVTRRRHARVLSGSHHPPQPGARGVQDSFSPRRWETKKTRLWARGWRLTLGYPPRIIRALPQFSEIVCISPLRRRRNRHVILRARVLCNLEGADHDEPAYESDDETNSSWQEAESEELHWTENPFGEVLTEQFDNSTRIKSGYYAYRDSSPSNRDANYSASAELNPIRLSIEQFSRMPELIENGKVEDAKCVLSPQKRDVVNKQGICVV
ncbi:hypothetical protein EVAR_98592_1 [Eumeta japonica]|uniref:Uncharacterized protein n=1 Tax=Eumeta variegata TaxID=151549 RepID=A0A4C1T3F7_EUMVA|nr:hypothetical protein EVAR_98592_1 [Eumeta japonica]